MTDSVGVKCRVAQLCGADADGSMTQRDLAKQYGVSKSAVGNHRQGDCGCSKPDDKIAAIASLLDRSGIAVDDIAKIDRVKVYEGYIKNSAGDAEKVEMTSVVLSPTWGDGPAWPVVQQAKPTVVKYGARTKAKREGKVTILLPDPQIGYRRYDDGTLDPMHDEHAMACAVDLIRGIQPDRVINLGDFLDHSAWSSKFLVHPEFVLTTQPAIDRGHRFLADQRAACAPETQIDLIEGNHDDRMTIAITKNSMEAVRLKRANAPESWPVLSLPFLLRLDELAVNYEGGYPAGRLKVADARGGQTPLYALHGKKLDMIKQAKSERYSTVQGHSHHVSMHTETYDYDGEPQQVQSWSMGCLARLDGAVPGTKGGTDSNGHPMPIVESWQHAVGVVTETSDGWWLEPVFIHDGVAMWQGQVFNG